ncbi:LysR family transcriptional regulator [Paraoerskovia marina]|uniref:LysR family transcriptional regulator n=1 Tax=Paraoerskovia marina TaxID=545619 RepID=UPI000492DB8B|nr:LysR substrate-binding domain-containing protein [Paraoerskovia marina]
MDLHRLTMLVAVAREGSVTAAAAALRYSQPSVSHHLALLEAEVGVPLLQRVGRGVRLTDAGTLLVGRAEEILGRVEAAESEVRALAGLQAGRARLAAFPSALATIVPEVVARLGAEHPGVGVELVEHEPPEALAALRQGTVDVALVFEHDYAPSDLHGLAVTAVTEDPMVLVTATTSDSPGGPAVLGDHAGSAWIAGCERCRTDLVARCEREGFTPQITFETDDYVAVQALVAAGVGVSLLPALALRAHRADGVDVTAVPGAHRRVLAVTYGDRPAPAAGALVRLVVSAARRQATER